MMPKILDRYLPKLQNVPIYRDVCINKYQLLYKSKNTFSNSYFKDSRMKVLWSMVRAEAALVWPWKIK